MPANSSPPNVVVLYGGNSPERSISLESGTAVAEALSQAGYQVTLLDPANHSVKTFNWQPDSIAIVMLHGTYGEDGQVQAELDALNIPYSGSNRTASRIAFHKQTAKEIFATQQLPTPDWQVIPATTEAEQLIAHAAGLAFPLVIKPAAQGSSIGVTIVEHQADLQPAFDAAKEFDDVILLEKAIIGEEWTVPVLDRHPLPAIRISSDRKFFDYSAKYEDESTQYEVIRQSDSATALRVTELSIQACASLNTSGICRVDLIVDRAGQPWLLEVNTIPGMTDHSLVPKSAREFGWSMPELCERILLSALPNRCS